MKRLWAFLGLVLVAVASPSAGQDSRGAFGVRMGQPLSSLNVTKRFKDGDYEIVVPTPNSEFDFYSVRVTPTTGVCKLTAFGKTHTGDSCGTDVRSAFGRLHDVLVSRYGTAKDYDFLKDGSIWNEPRDFHMGGLKGERTLSSFWLARNGSTLPSQFSPIGLDVQAVDGGPYVVLNYEFSNFAKCKTIRDTSDNAGL